MSFTLHWEFNGRDVLPNLTPAAGVSDVGAGMLHAMLGMDGTAWAPPYTALRKALKIRKKTVVPELEKAADQRIRTYAALFREIGLVSAEDRVRTTPLGDYLRDFMDAEYLAVDDFARALYLAQGDGIGRLITLASILLEDCVVSGHGGGAEQRGAWVDVPLLFERAIKAVVERTLPTCRVDVGEALDTPLLRGVSDRRQANPDIVVQTAKGAVLLDPKYRSGGVSFDPSALYQLMAHADAFNACAAALVAPAAGGTSRVVELGADSHGRRYVLALVDPTSARDMERVVGSWVSTCASPS